MINPKLNHRLTSLSTIYIAQLPCLLIILDRSRSLLFAARMIGFLLDVQMSLRIRQSRSMAFWYDRRSIIEYTMMKPSTSYSCHVFSSWEADGSSEWRTRTVRHKH